jgi:hypothetical protein
MDVQPAVDHAMGYARHVRSRYPRTSMPVPRSARESGSGMRDCDDVVRYGEVIYRLVAGIADQFSINVMPL